MKQKLLLFLLITLIFVASCTKERVFEDSYSYYKDLSLEEVIKLGDNDIWQEIYSPEKTKALVPIPESDTLKTTYYGRFKGMSDSGGITCDANYPDEVCYTILIVNTISKSNSSDNKKQYIIIYDRPFPIVRKY